jgi:putative NADPH-quinone reductase
MSRRITIIQGHPDPSGQRFGHALAKAYVQGATEAGHEVRLIEVAKLDFPLLRTQEDWKSGTLPASLPEAQDAIGWAEHLVFFFPLWLGTMPALLKAFLEQVARPGFAIGGGERGNMPMKLLSGKSARIVVTMGMPAFLYRWYFLAHGLRGLERNILGFAVIAPIRETLIGMIDASEKTNREKWLPKLRALGHDGK